MNKNRVLKICGEVCIGLCIGGVAMFCSDMMTKRNNLDDALDIAIDKGDLKTARKIDKEIELIDDTFNVMEGMAITLSMCYILNLVFNNRTFIFNNRTFNEINYILTACHMIDTDDTISISNKIEIMKEIKNSGKFGKVALGLLQDQIEKLLIEDHVNEMFS